MVLATTPSSLPQLPERLSLDHMAHRRRQQLAGRSNYMLELYSYRVVVSLALLTTSTGFSFTVIALQAVLLIDLYYNTAAVRTINSTASGWGPEYRHRMWYSHNRYSTCAVLIYCGRRRNNLRRAESAWVE